MSAITTEIEKFLVQIPEKLTDELIKKDPSNLIAVKLLERSNTKKAMIVDSIIKRDGVNRFGPMWSEIQGVLPGGREVHLQSSTDTLEIDIPATKIDPVRTHIRYDLVGKKIYTYETRLPNHEPIFYYQVNLPEDNIPKRLSRLNVLRNVGDILTQVENAILNTK
jgi:hypothetical protein